MAKSKTREVGDVGEGVVCRFLEKRGYKMLERNYWKPWGEIDIVAEKAGIISFIEVKTVRIHTNLIVSREPSSDGVSPETPFRPEENMHPAKIKRLHRAIQTYLMERKVPESKEWQLDLACVYLDFSTKRARVELIENIVL